MSNYLTQQASQKELFLLLLAGSAQGNSLVKPTMPIGSYATNYEIFVVQHFAHSNRSPNPLVEQKLTALLSQFVTKVTITIQVTLRDILNICHDFVEREGYGTGQGAIKKGSTANATPWGFLVQPFGSIPSFLNLSRQESLTHELKFPLPATASICSSNESSKRMCFMVLPVLSNAFFSFLSCIGSYQYYNGIENGNYHFGLNQYGSTKIATPRSARTLPRRLTSNVKETNAMAETQHTQTHTKFQYRFLALNRHDKKSKPCRLSVEATTEHEARRILAPHFILSFAARLPVQEVHHV